MQLLNVKQLTWEQLEKLLHKLPNYIMMNQYSLKEHIQQNDENAPFSMSTWLIIVNMVIVTPIGITGIATIAISNIGEPQISSESFL